jgi:hypothetical protein
LTQVKRNATTHLTFLSAAKRQRTETQPENSPCTLDDTADFADKFKKLIDIN